MSERLYFRTSSGYLAELAEQAFSKIKRDEMKGTSKKETEENQPVSKSMCPRTGAEAFTRPNYLEGGEGARTDELPPRLKAAWT